MKLLKDNIIKSFSLMDHQVKVLFQFCDFEDEQHCEMVAELINQHLSEPLGGGTPLTPIQKLRVVDGLATHPACFVLFASIDEVIVGMATCFVNFSTFNAKSFITIQDLIVLKEYRRLGIGTALLNKCINVASKRGFCKVTIEVSNDSSTAKSLYKKTGFNEIDSGTRIWTKTICN